MAVTGQFPVAADTGHPGHTSARRLLVQWAIVGDVEPADVAVRVNALIE
jgi:hypothetical protein